MIGVYACEKNIIQELSIDITFSVDVNRAAACDSISDTQNYFKIYHAIFDFVKETRCQLLETLGNRLADHLKKTFQLSWIQLSITKKPMNMPHAVNVCLVIER